MNTLLFIIVGGIVAYFVPHEPYIADSVFNFGAIAMSLAWFVIGGMASTIIRFVGPKKAHVITLLGTLPLQVLRTGINITLPWPLGWTQAIITTNVEAKQAEVQIKSRDNLVFLLPVTFQYHVADPMKYAFERDNPDQQMINLGVASIRAAANSKEFQAIYDDKDSIKADVLAHIAATLASFGIVLDDVLIEDPKLSPSTAVALNSIREAEYGKQAAAHNAETIYVNKVGAARAEVEATRLKGGAMANLRLQIAEGNAGAIAVMQGKLALKWVDEEVGEGENKKTMKVAKFIDPKTQAEVTEVPITDVAAGDILEFFKIIDSNEAIRDAAGNLGTVIIAPAGGQSGSFDFSNVVAISKALENKGVAPKAA